MNNKIKSFISSLTALALLTTGSLITISKVLGVGKYTFTASSFFLPTIISFFSLPISGLLFGIWYAIKIILGSGPRTFGIPTQLAGVSLWLSRSKGNSFYLTLANNMFHIGYPLTCIAVFMSSPSVGIGAPYALLWLIPVTIHSLQQINLCSNVFANTLKSTFIAHATGSLIYLVMVPLAPAQWLGLIPTVIVERCVIATGQALMITAVNTLSQRISVSQTIKTVVQKFYIKIDY